MEKWDPWILTPQITSIIITTAILLSIFFTYNYKIKRLDVNQAPKGLVLIMEIIFTSIRKEVVLLLGKKWEKLTPYFIFLLMYLGVGNLLSIVGFEPPASTYTVPLSLGIVTWIGMFAIGIRVQSWLFINQFTVSLKIFKIKTKKGHIGILPNPMAPFEFFSKLLSISFRLWGNIFAGGMILTLTYLVTGLLSSKVPIIGQLNFMSLLIAPFLHMYFDLFAGLVQAYIFMFLTISYWSTMASEQTEPEVVKKVEIKTHEDRLKSIKLKR